MADDTRAFLDSFDSIRHVHVEGMTADRKAVRPIVIEHRASPSLMAGAGLGFLGAPVLFFGGGMLLNWVFGG